MTQPGSSPKSPLGFDEFVAIFVAFSTLGAILFFSLPEMEAGSHLSNRKPIAPIADPRAESRSVGESEESMMEPMDSLRPAAGAIAPAASLDSEVDPSLRTAKSATERAPLSLFALPLFFTDETPKTTPNAMPVEETTPTEEAAPTESETPAAPDASPEATPAETAP